MVKLPEYYIKTDQTGIIDYAGRHVKLTKISPTWYAETSRHGNVPDYPITMEPAMPELKAHDVRTCPVAVLIDRKNRKIGIAHIGVSRNLRDGLTDAILYPGDQANPLPVSREEALEEMRGQIRPHVELLAQSFDPETTRCFLLGGNRGATHLQSAVHAAVSRLEEGGELTEEEKKNIAMHEEAYRQSILMTHLLERALEGEGFTIEGRDLFGEVERKVVSVTPDEIKVVELPFLSEITGQPLYGQPDRSVATYRLMHEDTVWPGDRSMPGRV